MLKVLRSRSKFFDALLLLWSSSGTVRAMLIALMKIEPIEGDMDFRQKYTIVLALGFYWFKEYGEHGSTCAQDRSHRGNALPERNSHHSSPILSGWSPFNSTAAVGDSIKMPKLNAGTEPRTTRSRAKARKTHGRSDTELNPSDLVKAWALHLGLTRGIRKIPGMGVRRALDNLVD